MANSLPSLTTDYSKFTVPQLKDACKELSITGYSKLGKAALLERLAQHAEHAKQKPKETVGSLTEHDIQSLASEAGQEKANSSNSGSRRSYPDDSSFAGALYDGQLLQESSLPQNSPPLDRLTKATSAVANENRPTNPSALSTPSANVSVIKVPSKRKENPPGANSSSRTPNPLRDGKKAKPLVILDLDRRILNAPLASSNLHECAVVSENSIKNSSSVQSSDESTGVSASTVMIEMVKFPEASSRSLTRNQVLAPSRSFTQSRRFIPPKTMQRNNLSQAHQSSKHPVRPSGGFASFDVHSLTCFALKAIEMPPSLSQRKRVHAWSVILSGLSDPERRQCALVSRMLRYAGTYCNVCRGL